VADALSYLHNVERLVHLNISPQCVVVTRKGMWKLIGLGFAQTWSEPGQQVRRVSRTRSAVQWYNVETSVTGMPKDGARSTFTVPTAVVSIIGKFQLSQTDPQYAVRVYIRQSRFTRTGR